MRSDHQIETTGTRLQTRCWTGRHPPVLQLVVLLASAWPLPAPAAPDGQPPAPSATTARQSPRGHSGENLDDRVKSLSTALDLDPRQQAELRKVLVAQRQEILAVWADESTPAAVRVKATELIGQRTGDRIRALLNDQQRARYNPPRTPSQAAPGSARPGVEAWMNRTTAS